MTLSLTLACLWALAATAVAFLPYRWQIVPGLALLLCAPALVGFVGHQHGAVVAGLILAAVLSLFRKPLAYLARRGLARLSGRKDAP
ncbi:hypothetical protein Ga0609869_000394 [Rhodovulum iodosum]|uniref:DUF2484 family protein n=1 Tax=Rhodovulum iodosum TaxID=68291 RepID=A0ABV3XP08_9RHOB|nr:DUF2484 family protein [Rhodovulum robiginosum]RSK37982.1 DUF2484 family protein [Rhodovulum robiginosum]